MHFLIVAGISGNDDAPFQPDAHFRIVTVPSDDGPQPADHHAQFLRTSPGISRQSITIRLERNPIRVTDESSIE